MELKTPSFALMYFFVFESSNFFSFFLLNLQRAKNGWDGAREEKGTMLDIQLIYGWKDYLKEKK